MAYSTRKEKGTTARVSQLKLGLPLFRPREEGQRQVSGMDEHDVRAELIKGKEQMIIEITNRMASMKRL
jgi:hypothetical protein